MPFIRLRKIKKINKAKKRKLAIEHARSLIKMSREPLTTKENPIAISRRVRRDVQSVMVSAWDILHRQEIALEEARKKHPKIDENPKVNEYLDRKFKEAIEEAYDVKSRAREFRKKKGLKK